MLCFVVVMQSFIMNSYEVFIHIHQGCFAGTGAIVRLPQCQWSKPDGYGKISQCITTTKHSKAKTVCIFLGIHCMLCAAKWETYGSLKLILSYAALHYFVYIIRWHQRIPRWRQSNEGLYLPLRFPQVLWEWSQPVIYMHIRNVFPHWLRPLWCDLIQ